MRVTKTVKKFVPNIQLKNYNFQNKNQNTSPLKFNKYRRKRDTENSPILKYSSPNKNYSIGEYQLYSALKELMTQIKNNYINYFQENKLKPKNKNNYIKNDYKHSPLNSPTFSRFNKKINQGYFPIIHSSKEERYSNWDTEKKDNIIQNKNNKKKLDKIAKEKNLVINLEMGNDSSNKNNLNDEYEKFKVKKNKEIVKDETMNNPNYNEKIDQIIKIQSIWRGISARKKICDSIYKDYLYPKFVKIISKILVKKLRIIFEELFSKIKLIKNNKENLVETEDNRLKRLNIIRHYFLLWNVSVINLSEEIFSKIFNNLNIFNSILLLLSNISYTLRKMDKLNEPKTIFENVNKRFSLSFILYSLNRFLFKKTKYYEIYKKDFEFSYEMFIRKPLIKSKKNIPLEEYLNDINNAHFIFKYIVKKINKELYNKVKIKILNNNYNNLIEFLNKYSKKYSSFISDHFIGFNIKQQLHFKYSSKIYFDNFDFFFDFVFDLNDISKYDIDNKCIGAINLINCFINLNNQINNKQSKVYSLPDVLTIILKPYDYNNIDFKYPDELQLNKILFSDDKEKYKLNEDGIYLLVGMLCKYSFDNKFVCYYINQNNGVWYYRKDKNIVQKIEEFDINTKPIILIYQKRNSLEFEYRKLERKEKSFFVFCNYINGLKRALYVSEKLKISQIINILSNNSGKKIEYLLMNGRILESEKTLEENGIGDGDNIVVFSEDN